MTTDKKPEDQITEATAVELKDSDLEGATGGLNFTKILFEDFKSTTSATEALADGSVRPVRPA